MASSQRVKAIKAIKADPQGVLKKMTTEEVATLVQEANFQYYNKGTPLFSDTLYDWIKDNLRARDPAHPILDHVGAVVDSGKKVPLPHWMGSLDKIKSESGEVRQWMQRHPGHVVVSDKLDGNSALFTWDAAKRVARLFTRGNGREGQDISHLLPFVSGFPASSCPPSIGAVRGELIISRPAFRSVSMHGKNARNMVAGLLNAKKPDLALLKNVEFVAYEMICCASPPLCLSQQLKRLKEAGFGVVFHKVLSADRPDILEALSKTLHDRRQTSRYEVDGIVVYHDVPPPKLATEGNPKYAFAFKSVVLMDRAEVVVTAVEWGVSKDGYFKPVVVFDGVELAGVTVRRATGHNAKFVVDNRIGPGARIVVMRSGDVIPHIMEVLEPAEVVTVPRGKGVRWTESGVDLVGSVRSPEVALRALAFFFEKVDVRGLSKGTVRKLFDAGYDTVGKILQMGVPELSRIEGFGAKSAEKLVGAVHERLRAVDAVTLMAASNCFGRGVGVRTLQGVVRKFPDIVVPGGASVASLPSLRELAEVPGIEAKTAEKILGGLGAWAKFVRDNGLAVPVVNGSAPTGESGHFLKNKTVVFTGVRDKGLEAAIAAAGGDVKTSVSKKTDLLVYDPTKPASTKMHDAQKHGVATLAVDEFRAKLSQA